ncbi:MAG: hypothetical protein FJX60_20475 [Alphaproteobacteria bacterium]|nr:hypothetical protein [Alphaproteobacteria bacterium]
MCFLAAPVVADEPLTEEWSRAREACLLIDLELRMDWSRFANPFAELWEEALDETDDRDDSGAQATQTGPRLTLLPNCSGESLDP